MDLHGVARPRPLHDVLVPLCGTDLKDRLSRLNAAWAELKVTGVAGRSDGRLVVGSSLIVYSGFRFVEIGARRGIGPGPTIYWKAQIQVEYPSLHPENRSRAAGASRRGRHQRRRTPFRLKQTRFGP